MAARHGSVRALTGLIVALLAASGCGRKITAQPPTPAIPRASVPLPEWAPKNPSPEFLRAARVLKPLPRESGEALGMSPQEAAQSVAKLQATWIPAYEFLGSFTDEQVKAFLSTKKLRVPVKSLTDRQRGALNKWFDTWRTVMRGDDPDDYMVILYKNGATEDLSNVDVGFATVPVGTSSSSVISTHRVHLWFWVRKADGSTPQMGTGFAQI
ncbi:MAG: hypothetical protein ABSD48_19675 [Armatimonadota bacterium]|jgi:hypothetical protein